MLESVGHSLFVFYGKYNHHRYEDALLSNIRAKHCKQQCKTHFRLGQLTYGITQRKVVALRGEYGEDARLAEAAVGAGDDQREHAHDGEHAHFGDEDAPQERPDDVAEVQLHHLLEEQRRKCELGHEVAQPFSLAAGDDVGSAGDVAAQDDPEALHKSREELVDGHGGVQRGGRRVLLLLHV